jgi:hypothetical protein
VLKGAQCVRCDTELGLPVSEYRSFFDRCVGLARSGNARVRRGMIQLASAFCAALVGRAREASITRYGPSVAHVSRQRPVGPQLGTCAPTSGPLHLNEGALALQCLDLKRKQRIKVTCPHEMIDIESVSMPETSGGVNGKARFPGGTTMPRITALHMLRSK